jgi:hypothetical protein
MIFLAKHLQWLEAIAEEQQRLITEHGTAMDRTVRMPLCGTVCLIFWDTFQFFI